MANDVEKRITAKMVLDSSGFNSSLQGVNQQLKLAQSELKASSAQVGVFGKETDKLKVNSEGLSKQIELQRQKVDIYKDSIEKSTQKLKDSVTARDQLKEKLQEETAKYNDAIKLYGKESEEAKKAKESVDNLTQEYKKKEKQVESTAKTINNYTVNMNKADAELGKLQSELRKTNEELAKNENKWLSASKSLENASTKITAVGNKMSSIGTSLSIGVTAPIIGIGTAATHMAMEAVESENLFEVSMGKMAGAAREWSQDLRKNLGLNEYELRKSVGVYYQMLVNMGQNEKQAYGMSTALVKLAYDMSSFYNIPIDVAFEKVRAGITGESEPLKQLGIIINETTTQQYALSNGLIKQIPVLDSHGKAVKDAFGKIKTQTQDMDEATKVQARYGLLMQLTTKAQGDLDRTLDSPTNKLRVQTENIKQQAIELGTKLIPLLSKGLDVIKPIVDWFDKLSDSQKEQVIKLGLMAAAAGPVLKVAGEGTKLIGGLTGKLGAFTKIAGGAAAATEGVGAAAVAGEAGVAGLGAAIGGALLPLAPWIIGIGLATVGGIALAKHLKEDSIPQVQLFGEETSDATKKAVQGYMDLDDKATKSLMSLKFSSGTVTQEIKNNMINTYSEMGRQINEGLKKHNDEQLATMQNFFANNAMLTDTEEAKIIKKMQDNSAWEKGIVDDGVRQINEIYARASKEHRAIKDEEYNLISNIQQNMKTSAVKALSETEIEEKAILERMKLSANDLTARQAADVVKNSVEQRDKAVAAAEQQANNVIKEAIRQRDEKHTISAEEADRIIEAAERQKVEAIRKAEDMHNEVVRQAKTQAEEHVNEVNWETGEIKSKWEKFKSWLSGLTLPKKKVEIDADFGLKGHGGVGMNADGTNYWKGGLTTMHEKKYELYNLPRGTRIYNHDASEDMVLKTAQEVAKGVLSNYNLQSAGVSTVIVPVYLEGQKIAEVTAPYDNKIQGTNLAFSGRSSGM